jgi:asparagine synthase (glutamine-hydrolysing)
MCGIAGVFGGRVEGAPLVAQMLDILQHRGPDGEGLWTQPNGGALTLAHRRLAILDLSPAGAQPMHDPATGCVLTFNGEIYNFVEVREELARLGARFSTGSDTEVILAAYAHWGAGCLERFNGMFAFALYDPRRQVLFCARDRYGEKPFLFHAAPGLFVFASEYKAILLHPDVPFEIDDARLLRAAHNASTGLDADRDTVFRGVCQLLPGEALELSLDSGAVRTWRYWQVPPAPAREIGDEREVFEEFRRLLVDSVRLRLRSDVPVGSCLSGGLDSSAIVCIVRQLLGDDRPYHTFTGHFPGSQADEWHFAREVVDATRSTSHRVEPSVDRFMAQLPEFAWHNELPVGSSSQFAQWSVFQLAREHGVTVLLDGQGADEGLGGYEQYFGPYLAALRERGDGLRLERELPAIRARYPLALASPSRALRDRLPFRARNWISNGFGIGTSMLYGLRPDLARQVESDTAPRRKAGFDPLASALEQDSFGRYLTTLLRYGDRNSMAHSREVRLPFCDHRIAEFVLRLPPHLVMGEIQTKRLLRESMRGILPEVIRTRWNKQGFRPPQETWFESPAFLALARDTLSAPGFVGNPAWEAPWWHRALDRIAAGETRLGWIVWAPLSIEWWRRHFVDEMVARRAAVSAGRVLGVAA